MAAGSLCYSNSGGALAYKRGVGLLIFSRTASTGDIYVAVEPQYANVGPIQTCKHRHNVYMSNGGSDVKGRLEFTLTPIATQSFTIQSFAKGGEISESSSCEYPDENPPMQFMVCVMQPATGVTLTIDKSVDCVAYDASNPQNSFSVTVNCVSGRLTSVS